MKAPKHLAFVAFCAVLKTSLGVVEKVGGKGRAQPDGRGARTGDEGASADGRDHDAPPG